MLPRSGFGLCAWLVILFCIIASATDENVDLDSYLSLPDAEDHLNVDKRFQQIMQGNSGSDVNWPQPPKPKTEKIDVKAEIAKLNTTYVYDSSWPDPNLKFGSVTAVSFDKAGNVVIFHRVDRIWGQNTFDISNNFRQRRKGPILESTVLALERQSGKLVYDWGKKLFYMPHGLTIDHEDNVWVTDVALHQVFKFGPRGSNDVPLMTLGTAFTPGAGLSKFCKPTSVAVLENGDFFIADGYCNARILKYSKNGERILYWGQHSFSGVSYEIAPNNYFAIPHALTLVPEQELVCTADRENGRVQCFFWRNGTYHSQYHSPIIGDRLFSMDYTPAYGGQFVIVNGPNAEFGNKNDAYNEVRGYVMNMNTKEVVSKFGPHDVQFENPHDVAVSEDGGEIYVAELDPMRVHKFLHKSRIDATFLSATKLSQAIDASGRPNKMSAAASTNTNEIPATGADENSDYAASSTTGGHHRPGSTAILVATLMLLFAFLTFGLALLVARRRKRAQM